MPSVLWRCWLGSRKGILGCWSGYLSGARCRLAYGPADATATHCLASVKSRLVLPFRYRPTWVVLEKGPLNGCVCVYPGYLLEIGEAGFVDTVLKLPRPLADDEMTVSCEVYTLSVCCVFLYGDIWETVAWQSNPLKWIAQGPDYEYPVRQSIHLSMFQFSLC